MKNYIVRVNEEFLFQSFERSFVSALLGPRRVGKTTIINYYMQTHPERIWVSLNMDVLSQRNRVANEKLEEMIEEGALQKIGGTKKIWVFIDEAQKCPELFDQVKLIYDSHIHQDRIKFILTGSAHLNLHELTAESLAGRVELLQLREFNLREMTLLRHPELMLPSKTALKILFNKMDVRELQELHLSIRPFQKLFLETLENHLLWGGLPEIIPETSQNLRLKYLGDYLQTYLEKDIRPIDAISDLHLYQNLMKICAELTGKLQDDNQILSALHCARNTLIKYRNYLYATLQYREIYPYVESSIKRLVKSPKGYLINNGLISYLTGIHENSILKSTGLIGHRFENWFLNEIQTWMDTCSERTQISFWRTHDGAEVDFVVSVGAHVIPFEVTYSSEISHKKLKNLKSFLAKTPKAKVGVFCYTGPFDFDQKHNILFLPAWFI